MVDDADDKMKQDDNVRIDGEALIRAAGNDDVQAIKELIERGVPISYCSVVGGGQTALHHASIAGNVNAVETLIRLGAPLSVSNHISSASPLHLAAMGKGSREQKMQVITALVRAGADCLKEDRYGSLPWHYAQDEGMRLAMKGPDFRIHNAVHSTNLALLGKYLAEREYPEQVNELGQDGSTPLHCAVLAKSSEAVKMLVAAGAAVDLPNDHGGTSLHTAVSVLSQEIADLLINYGANVNAKSYLVDEYHTKGCNWAVLEEGEPSPLSEGGLSPENKRGRKRLRKKATKCDHETPLHIAVKKNSIPLAKLLLTHGAQVDSTDHNDKTPLHLALENLLEASRSRGNADEACKSLITLLLEKGADPTKGNGIIGHDRSTLHWAVMEGHLEALELLINHSFGTRRALLIDCQDKEGLTPLMVAAREGKVSCVEALLRHGASDTMMNGQNARSLAQRYNNQAVISIIDTFQTFAPKA